MRNQLFTILSLFLISVAMTAQVPFAFRYQASVRDDSNRPIIEEVEFDIQLFADAYASDLVYSESHIIEPDTNGLVAFSIGEGETSYDFSTIVWAEGPYYIQVLLDGTEISFSQLISVPYAMHAQTAGKIHNLQSPVLANDPTTKAYVDDTINSLQTNIKSVQTNINNIQDSINSEQESALINTSRAIDEAILTSKTYADSLAITPKDLEVASSGDTLVIGNTVLVIPGMSSDNMPKYSNQLVLGGSYNETLAKSIRCQDSSFLLMGTTQSANGDVNDFKGDADIWIIKLSKSLKIEWTKTLGGSRYDNPVIILEEKDGYLIGATTESNDGDISHHNGEFDIWLVKVDFSGSISWENTYGGAGTEFINAIIPKDDGGYFVGATTFSNGGDISYLNGESDIWIFELDENNEISNTLSIGGSKYDALTSMSLNNDVLSLYGTSSSNDGAILKNNGALDFVHIKLNKDLKITEQTCFGKTTNEQLQFTKETSTGEFLIGNTFAENWSIATGNTSKNIYIEYLGTNSWNKQLGGSNSDILIDAIINNDTLTLLTQTASQDGDIKDAKGSTDIWLVQLAPDGIITKSKILGGTYEESPRVIKPLPKGGWLIGAESESFDGDLTNNSGEKDIWIVKIDNDFNVVWQKAYGGSYNESLNDILIIDDTNFIICGSTSSNDFSITGLHDKAGKSNDIWVLQTTID